MRLSTTFPSAVFAILVRETAALAAHPDTLTSTLRDTGPRLEVRQRETGYDDVRSGTLTITVAPDATCGFDDLDDPVLVCDAKRPCTWELGRYARAFCGWASLRTTCLDSSAYFNTDICDEDCRTNKLIHSCTSSGIPYCARIRFGNGIVHYTCHSTTTHFTINTTPSLEERELSTVILVDGTPVSTIVESNHKTTTDSTQTTSDPTHQTSAGPEPAQKTNVGAILGGVLGGVAVIGLLVLGAFGLLILRRRNRSQGAPSPDPGPPVQQEPNTPNTKGVAASSGPPELYG